MTTSDWSSLPDDILGIIAGLLHLQSPDDFCRCRAVCRSFLSSSSVAIPSRPTLTPNPPPFSLCFQENGNNFSLTKSSVYAIQPLNKIVSNPQGTTPTWLVRIEESSTGKLRIKHPRGWFHFYNQHSYDEYLPKYLNLLDCKVKKITDSYQLMPYGHDHVNPEDLPLGFTKVVVSESPDGLVVMAIHRFAGNLFVWRYGDWSEINGLERWNETDIGAFRFFSDIVHHNEKFYALIDGGQAIVVDSKSLSITNVANCPQTSACNYLVKSLTDLFLVVRGGNRYCHVYKLDEVKCRWVPVGDLGLENRVLFVGSRYSFSLSAGEYFSGFKGDCVCFIGCDESVRWDESGNPIWKGHLVDNTNHENSSWIFDLKNNVFRPLTDFPSYSNIFWPPPSWLKQC